MDSHLPRHGLPGLAPVLETDQMRSPDLGFESGADLGVIRCLEHGYPTPLARWHCHNEYELHLITATSGTAFVGDWVGEFSAGHLVLCGPGLPHNWISMDCPAGGVACRDRVVLFPHDLVAAPSQTMPELDEARRLLDLASYGIEFFGLADVMSQGWLRIKASRGLERLALLYELLAQLSRCEDYRLLNRSRYAPDERSEHFQRIATSITHEPGQALSAEDYANECRMDLRQFLRLFKKHVGQGFHSYVNQARLAAACRLLATTGLYVQSVCYAVGFNNLSNFNRRFLEAKGVTPSDYRKQHR
ncbi:MAG: AraC family transcriptional regulator [Bordetella sp.]|nr:AraC family transcriptional regulator [Pseudomonadota bacterium]